MPCDYLLGDVAEILIDGHQALRLQIFPLVGSLGCIRSLFQALYLIADLDGFAAVLGSKFQEQDPVAVFPLLQDAWLLRSVDGFYCHSLKGVGGGQRQPQAGGAGYFGQDGPIEKLELVLPFDDPQVGF